jgi:hypothetical protein
MDEMSYEELQEVARKLDEAPCEGPRYFYIPRPIYYDLRIAACKSRWGRIKLRITAFCYGLLTRVRT